MSIAHPNSVLILGAGSSVPFGMPTGFDLIDGIHEALMKEMNTKHRVMNFRERGTLNYVRLENNNLPQTFSERPLITSLAKSYLIDHKINEKISIIHRVHEDQFVEAVMKFAALLDNQTSDTIDDFIVQNPTYSRFAKVAASVQMFVKIYRYSSEQNTFTLNNLSTRRLTVPNRAYEFGKLGSSQMRDIRNWVHLLINIMRQARQNGKAGGQAHINIITFNYDSILEHILDEQFANSELAAGLNWREYFTIHHMHGKFPDFERAVKNPWDVCVSWADAITVVQEQSECETVNTAREDAKSLLRRARKIYACGFAFSGPNCRLLNLAVGTWIQTNQVIRFCNYDGNQGLSEAVHKFDTSDGRRVARHPVSVLEDRGSPERPISIEDWFYSGALGELPA